MTVAMHKLLWPILLGFVLLFAGGTILVVSAYYFDLALLDLYKGELTLREWCKAWLSRSIWTLAGELLILFGLVIMDVSIILILITAREALSPQEKLGLYIILATTTILYVLLVIACLAIPLKTWPYYMPSH